MTIWHALKRVTLGLCVWVVLPIACANDQPPEVASVTSQGVDAGTGTTCTCPPAGDFELPLPPDTTSADVGGLNTSSCSAEYDPATESILVSGTSGNSPACTVNVQVSGAVLSAFVSFEYLGRDCGWRATGSTSLSVQADSIGCNCPELGFAQLTLPSEVAGRVVDVTADVCQVFYNESLNSMQIAGGSASASPCTIVASLADQSALQATAEFQWLGGCCGWGNVTSTSVVQPVDGGAPNCSR